MQLEPQTNVPAWSRSTNAYDPTPPPPPNQPKPVQPQKRLGFDAPRTVCLFGAPRAGVDTIAQILSEASNGVALLVPDFGDLAEQVSKTGHENPGRTILITGVPLSADALQGVWDMRLIVPPRGYLIEVQAPAEILMARGATEAAVYQFEQEHSRLVALAHQLNARILGVQNDGDLANAVTRLATLLELED